VILTGHIKAYLGEKKIDTEHSRTGSRHEKWNDVRVTFHFAMKFLAGVKIRRKDDTMDKLNVFAALKRYPMGCHCPSPETAQLGYRLNVSLQRDVFNFSFLRYARTLHRFLYC